MILRELHTTEIDCWIKEHHYLHSTPAGAVQRLCRLKLPPDKPQCPDERCVWLLDGGLCPFKRCVRRDGFDREGR